MVQHGLKKRVGKEAAAAVEGGQIPDDAAAVAAGGHTLLPAAGLHLDAVHCTLVLLHTVTDSSVLFSQYSKKCSIVRRYGHSEVVHPVPTASTSPVCMIRQQAGQSHTPAACIQRGCGGNRKVGRGQGTAIGNS